MRVYEIIGAEGPAAQIGAIYAGECDQIVRVWGPDGVRNLKARYAPYFEATDLAVKDCAKIPEVERKAWAIFMAEWRRFNAAEVSLFSAGADAIQACSHVRALDGWRERFTAYGCKLPGGDVKEYDPPWKGPLKIAAIAVIAVAAAGVLITYAPTIKAVLPSRK